MASDKIRLGVIGANPTVGWAPRPICPLSWPVPILN